MSDSILTSTKKSLGLVEDYDAFDSDIMMHINSVFMILNQMGIGPANGFMIEDAGSEWDEFLGGDPNLNAVKSYIYLRVRLLFDPPTTSFHLAAVQEQIKELTYRLSTYREGLSWSAPIQPLILP